MLFLINYKIKNVINFVFLKVWKVMEKDFGEVRGHFRDVHED